jgi:hypothetical protein
MEFRHIVIILGFAAGTALLGACASSEPAPSASTAKSATAPVPAPTASAATTESDTAAGLEKKFQEAAKGYKIVQRDGKNMYCKKEKVIGSTIPTLQCMSEAQLRLQVEQMDELRQRMRSGARCTLGPGCSGG